MSSNFVIPTTPARRYHTFLGVLCGLLLALAAGWVSQRLSEPRGPQKAVCALAAMIQEGKTFEMTSKAMGYPIQFRFEHGFLIASDGTAYRMLAGEVCFIAEDKS